VTDIAADAKVRRYLRDLQAFAAEAAYVASRGRDLYTADSPEGRLLRNAGERILIKVATVVERLPQSFKDAYPTIDWVKIARMRNLVAHHYDHVDDDLLWAALTGRIPALADALARDPLAAPAGDG